MTALLPVICFAIGISSGYFIKGPVGFIITLVACPLVAGLFIRFGLI